MQYKKVGKKSATTKGNDMVLSKSLWPIYDINYEDEIGCDVTPQFEGSYDLSNENVQTSMLNRWLTVTNQEHAKRFMAEFGAPFMLDSHGEIHDGRSAPWDPDPWFPSMGRILAESNRLIGFWKRYLNASKRKEGWDESVLVIPTGPLPGAIWTLEEVEHTSGNWGSHLTWSSTTDQERLGKSNYRKLKHEQNPFPAQYRQKERELSEALKRHASSNFEIIAEPTNPSKCLVLVDNTWHEVDISDMVYDAAGMVSKLMMMPLVYEVNRHLIGLSPTVDIVIDHSGPRCVMEYTVRTPIAAIYLALLREIASGTAWDVCPHPKCKTLYEKKPKNKSSCGKARCKSYVTRLRREQQED